MRRRPIAVLALSLTLVIVAGGCLVEGPYVSDTQTTPFSVELTADTPVATRDVVLTNHLRGGSMTAMLQLHGVDPRVRVAATGNADMDGDRTVDGLATFLHPRDGEIGLPLRLDTDCLQPPCGVQRLILELTSPGPGERVTVAGEVNVSFGFGGASFPPGPVVQLDGFGAGASRPAGIERTTRVTVAPTTLDNERPVAIQPVAFHLRTDPTADPLDLVSEVRVLPAEAAAGAGYRFTIESPDPERTGRVPIVMQGAPGTYAAAMGCQAPAADCPADREIRTAWDSTVPTVSVGYDLESVLVSYADDAPSRGTGVTAELADLASVPADAPRASGSLEGTLVLDGGADARAKIDLRFRLDGYPATTGAAVSEVPGTVVLTYSAVARDGPVPSDGPRIDLATDLCCQGRTSAPNLAFAPDGVVRTATYDILTACVAGTPCQVDFQLNLYQPQSGVPPQPITLTYRFDAEVTSFAAAPFPPGVSVTIGPKPSPSPSSTALPAPSAVAPPSR